MYDLKMYMYNNNINMYMYMYYECTHHSTRISRYRYI